MASVVSPAQTVLRTALRFGVGAGLLCTFWLLGLLLTGNDPFGPKRLMSLFLPPLAVVASQWALRKFFQPEGPGIKRSISAGLLAGFLAAATSAVGVYGVARLAGPEKVEASKAAMIRIAEGSKADYLRQPNGKENYERTIQGLKAVNEQGLALDDFTKKMLFVVLLSVPGGIFLRK